MNRPSTPPDATTPWDTVAIVGVGMIGGSIGLDLLARGLARRVVGIGRRAESLQFAKQRGACSATTLDLAEGVTGASLVIVCTPVGRIAADVRNAAARATDALITDVGSTKESIVAELDNTLPATARYVGSHPLAGSEKAGPAAAIAGLFQGRTVVVTPGATTDASDAQAIADFWVSLGAEVVRMSPEEHDRLLAAASHVPHLVAAALAAATPQDGLPLTAGGWADTTRIASGDAGLWCDILLSNRTNVLTSLSGVEGAIARFRAALEAGDAATLTQILNEAKRTRDAVGN